SPWSCCRKDPAVCAVRRWGWSNALGASEKYHSHGAAAFHVASWQWAGHLSDLYQANDLACATGSFLPSPRTHAASLGNWPRYRTPAPGDCRRYRAAAQAALLLYGLVLVSANAPAGDRIDPGRLAGARRSIHLFAADRSLHVASVGDSRRFSFTVSAKNSWGDGQRRDHSPGMVRSYPSFLLAQRRVAMEARHRRDLRELHRARRTGAVPA